MTEVEKAESLQELVARYGNLKGEMDSYKKQVEADNKAIKSRMAELCITEYESGGYVAKYSVSVSDDFDEGKLLDKLSSITYKDESGANVLVGTGLGIIKLKPYVDMSALEDAIYNGKINAAELASCRVRKETPRLTISKVKEKK